MYVLQLCHDYKAPFLSVAKQYAGLFKGTAYKVVTVYIKGKPDEAVIRESVSEEVVFLDYSSRDIRGLKRRPIHDLKQLHKKYQFRFAIAHRYKALYIASHVPELFCIGVHHIRGGYKRWARRLYVNRHKEQIALLGVSKAVRDNIRSDLSNFPSDRIGYLYNTLDYDSIRKKLLTREEARHKLRLSDDDYIIGNVGRLHPDKDQATLIRAFAKVENSLPNAKVVIAGMGRLESELKQQVHELGLEDRVIFLGMVPEVYRFYSAFDCFVLSSIKEGLPVALLEAFAARNICATSRCDGNEEAIEGIGESFDIGDDDKLARIIEYYYGLDKDQIDEMKDRIENKMISSFSEDRVRKAFWELPFVNKYL